jgi:tetratricopeptide (TPR) repeat protein
MIFTLFIALFSYVAFATLLLGGVSFIPLYEWAMASGIFGIATAYLTHAKNPPYQMSTSLYFLLGVGFPIAQMLLPFACLSPLALAVLFLHGRWNLYRRDRWMRQMWRADLRQMDRLIECYPSNAAAIWHKGEIYESQQSYSRAMKLYRRANIVCSDAYPGRDIRCAEQRIRSLHRGSRSDWWWFSLDWGWLYSFVFLSPFLFVSWKCFLTAYSLWLFALWCLKAETL